jgi:hypothetical protein
MSSTSLFAILKQLGYAEREHTAGSKVGVPNTTCQLPSPTSIARCNAPAHISALNECPLSMDALGDIASHCDEVTKARLRSVCKELQAAIHVTDIYSQLKAALLEAKLRDLQQAAFRVGCSYFNLRKPQLAWAVLIKVLHTAWMHQNHDQTKGKRSHASRLSWYQSSEYCQRYGEAVQYNFTTMYR